MPLEGYFVDAQLLVLLVAGNLNPDIIAKHRRLSAYTVEDYRTLLGMLSDVEQVFVTPNTLTEASNLLGQHREPERSYLFQELAWLVQHSNEVVVASSEASARAEFIRLGLTDSALLEAATGETPLLTVDLGLYLAALNIGEDAAVNFTHYRGL